MANNRQRVAPGLNFYEKDATVTQQRVTLDKTRLMILGEFEYGPAFETIRVSSYNEFGAKYGKLNPCKYKNTNQLKFQGSYTAKEFLKESTELYVCRVLGLSGYDAGDMWGIKVGGAVDLTTVAQGSTSTFTGNIQYNAGQLVSGSFSNPNIQSLFDEGILNSEVWGGYAIATGDTVSYVSTTSSGFSTDCNGTYTGAKLTAKVTNRVDTFVCITGTTNTTGYVTQSAITNTCTVQFGVGTQTVSSTLRIAVTQPLTIVNQNTSEIEIITSGTIVIKGGIITHNSDASITVLNGTITLPNGDILNGSQYKLCEIGSNVVTYDCAGIAGTGYSIVNGTAITYSQVLQNGQTTNSIQIPSGIVTIYFSGNTNTLTASSLTEYDDRLVCGLRSVATYDGNENLIFKVKNTNLVISSIDGGKISPYDDFVLSGFDFNGVAFSYNVSLDTKKKNYINKVFAKRANCCENSAPLYIAESYQVMFDNLVALGKVDCIKPTICHLTNLWNYKQEYTSAETPYLVSELRGTNVVRLFKFITISDGDAANKQIKVSITNIRPDTALFDVLIRAYDDSDKNPTILEQYTNCTLNVQSNNYIARKIGGTQGYPLVSKYVMVEIASECVYDAVPCGFEGYPLVEYSPCAKAPIIQYKTSYGSKDRVRNEYLGFNTSDGYDQDMFDYHGQPNSNVLTFTGETNGFHLDKLATSALVDGVGTKTFSVGVDEFKNESSLTGTEYEKLNARKYTVCFYGGFDGWDIHRLNTGNRTIQDEYSLNGVKGLLGLQSGAFDTIALTDFEGDTYTAINSDYYAYLKGIYAISNPDEVKFNLLVTPNLNTLETSNLVEEVIEMIEVVRCDTFYIVDTPNRDLDGIPYTAQAIANNLDGLYSTSFGATYAYDGVYNDTENNTYVIVPPSVDLPRTYAFSDKSKDIWWAPAGKQRGQSNFVNIVKNPTNPERDTLYGGRVNPMWKDSGTVLAFGNKTLQIEESSYDSINVRRLMIYIRQLLADVSVNLLFEQNDETLRKQCENLIKPILSNLRAERGIYDFIITLDNSAASLDRAELNGVIQIKPIRALEFINMGFILTKTGAEFENF